MPDNCRQRIIQFSLIVFCCLFVAVTKAETSVDCQSCTCIVGNLAGPPKFSWYTNQQVAVRIDDAWDPVDRGYFQEGIEKWNQADNVLACLLMTLDPFTLPVMMLHRHPQILRCGGKEPRL